MAFVGAAAAVTARGADTRRACRALSSFASASASVRSRRALSVLSMSSAAESLGPGDSAPAFSLPADDGSTVSLTSLPGSRTIVYFFPRADTPGCTLESCDFRDSGTVFSLCDATLVGISKDSVEDLKAFKEKYNLNFTLLSDKDSTVCEDYGVWQLRKRGDMEMMGINRSTFIIDEMGTIIRAWRGVKADGHVSEVESELLC